jgi:hypothetical protein
VSRQLKSLVSAKWPFAPDYVICNEVFDPATRKSFVISASV